MRSRNPLVEVRARRGWSRTQLAVAAGVAYNTVAAAELGFPARLSRSLLEGLAQLGEDPGALQREYIRWRAEQGRAMSGAVR